MEGLIRVERQKLSFTIDNILSRYPSYGAAGAALRERAASPAAVQVEAAHRSCICCCFCSRCGDMFHSEFIHEGRSTTLDPSAFTNIFPLGFKSSSNIDNTSNYIFSFFLSPCLLNWNDVSPLQPATTGGPQQRCQTPAGQETLATRSRARLRCTGEPGATAPFSLRSSWTRWRSCSCRTSTQM